MCIRDSDYLLQSGALTGDEMRTFRPSVCNRLDRNTSGIVAAGKSLQGLQELSRLFKDRTLGKYYLCLVQGEVKERSRICGFLKKDEKSNQVRITDSPEAVSAAIEKMCIRDRLLSEVSGHFTSRHCPAMSRPRLVICVPHPKKCLPPFPHLALVLQGDL